MDLVLRALHSITHSVLTITPSLDLLLPPVVNGGSREKGPRSNRAWTQAVLVARGPISHRASEFLGGPGGHSLMWEFQSRPFFTHLSFNSCSQKNISLLTCPRLGTLLRKHARCWEGQGCPHAVLSLFPVMAKMVNCPGSSGL